MEDDNVGLESDATFTALAKCALRTLHVKIRCARPSEHKQNDKRGGKWQHMFVFLAMNYGGAPCSPGVVAGQAFWGSGQ